MVLKRRPDAQEDKGEDPHDLTGREGEDSGKSLGEGLIPGKRAGE